MKVNFSHKFSHKYKFFRASFLFFLAISFLVVLNSNKSLGAQEKNLVHTKLDNGLEVFVLENNATPLVTIEIAFRAGSSYQTEETEGIFHLYEHMLFKGNSLYKNSAAIKNALTDMGISDYNGSTSTEFVNYYFTVPSSKFEKGLEFWASAVQNPLFNPDELEREKKVVISEISAHIHNKSQIAHNEIYKILYKDVPFTFSPSGNAQKVQSCTVEMLKKMKMEYYCPNNCALFISGNVNFNEAVISIEKYFGKWQHNDEFMAEKQILKNATNTTLDKNYSFFVQNPTYKSTLMIYFPGPNTLQNETDTYSADLLSSVLNDRNGNLYQNLKQIKTENGEEAIENFNASYLTTRINGVYAFAFELKNSIQDFSLIINEIQSVLLEELKKMENQSYFKKSTLDKLKISIEDERILREENPNTQIEGIRYFWAVCNTNYTLNYYKNMNKVNSKNLSNFCKKYLTTPHICVLYINDSAYKNQIPVLQKASFSEITENNLNKENQ